MLFRSCGSFPVDYVPEPTVRLNLYARMQRMTRADEIDAFADEVADRFGEPPEQVTTLFDLTRLKLIARERGIAKVKAGPRATAMSYRKAPTEARWTKLLEQEGASRREDRLILAQPTEPGPDRLKLVQTLLENAV